MKLSVEQANILDKIVEKSRMDCWFSITDDLTSIHDVETNRNISLRYGIGILNQGVTDLVKDYGLNEHEVMVYHDLLISLGLEKEQKKDMTKDDLGMNGKYTIINKVVTGTGFNVVLGINENHPIKEYRYVTWTQNDRGYDVGHYFGNLKEAQAEFMSQANHLYKKADIGVDQAIIDGIKELYEEYKEITVVDFDEDLDEIEME